ncbi:MAG: NHLP bacteriocin export ABC transporter permease/ATPase subunit [Reyranella sp.]|nr:NHLP bacteriocin export ABC transporter permease/ATPase subunit [Reyranella sp.]MDP3160966.1 NHLP bacteriocin export ABC transporter permease/ATPase subunit [Reyranella sp.]
MTDLAHLASPGRLVRPARLYAVVIGRDGTTGPRRFLVDLPQGAAVFAMAAPGVSFLLVGRDGSTESALLAAGPIDAAALDAWHGALLSWPGLTHADAAAVLMAAPESRVLPEGATVTAREIVWLRAATPILHYAATAASGPSAAMPLLVLANQVSARLTAEGEVRAATSASLLAESGLDGLDAVSSVHAAWIAAGVIASETAMRQAVEERRTRDEAEVSAALQRLSDVAAFRAPTVANAAISGSDPLAAALAVIAATENFTLRFPAADDRGAAVFDRLGRFANASSFRFREIALDDGWWKREGPAVLAIESAGGRPRAVVWRRRRWRVTDPETGVETVIDAAAAAALMPRGYMIYASLPEHVSTGRIWRFALFGARGDIARLLLAAAAATLAALLIPVATSAVLGYAIPDARTSLLADMMILLVAAAIGSAGFQVTRSVALVRLGTHIDLRLQAAIWDRVMRLKTSFFRDYGVGDLALRILGIDTIRRILAGQGLNGMIGGVFSLASLGVMLIYDARLALFAVGYALVAAGILFVLGRQQMRLERIVYERKGIVTGLLVEILGGIAKLRVAAAELRAFARWSNNFADQRANDARSGRLGAWQMVAAGSLPILGTLCVLAIAGGRTEPIDVAAFAAFNSAFGQFTAALLGLTGAINVSIEAAPLFARIRPVFEATLEVGENRVDPGPLGGHVAVRNLSFRYSAEGPWTLDNVEFEARPGENIAIVGASGSGKSTLLRLLLGFETPARGGVYYDGKDLETLDLRLLRRQIGTVLETAGLVPGSIFDNIAGSAPLTRDQVQEAIRLAGLDADIASMPMGLESFVMEGGSQLSGGQRQRVMIARALVNRPRLIFLDQATSALDNRTQAIVGASLAAMNGTRIVIAHRLSTIRAADRILVLDGGRIVQSGTYDELIGDDGAFRRLVERQLL